MIYDTQTETRVEKVYHSFFKEHLTIKEYMDRVILPHGSTKALNSWLDEQERKINLIMAAEIVGLLKETK